MPSITNQQTFSDLSVLFNGSRTIDVMPHSKQRCAMTRPIFSAADTSLLLKWRKHICKQHIINNRRFALRCTKYNCINVIDIISVQYSKCWDYSNLAQFSNPVQSIVGRVCVRKSHSTSLQIPTLETWDLFNRRRKSVCYLLTYLFKLGIPSCQ